MKTQWCCVGCRAICRFWANPMDLRVCIKVSDVWTFFKLFHETRCCCIILGETCSLVAVYGPAEVKSAIELIDRAAVDVVYKPKVGLPSCKDKQTEEILAGVCDAVAITRLHPRSLLCVVVQEMQDSGSFLACSINAMCLAMLDAAYPLHSTFAAVSCIYDGEEQLVLDPTLKQEAACSSRLTFVFESVEKRVVGCYTTGACSRSQHKKALTSCKAASDQIFEFYRESMKKKLQKAVLNLTWVIFHQIISLKYILPMNLVGAYH